MSFNVPDAAKGYFTPGFISQASSFLGEKEEGVRKALSGIIPAVVSEFVIRTNSGPNEANDILSIVINEYNSGIANRTSSFFSNEGNELNKGLSLVQVLFGNKLNNLVSSVSSFAGVKYSSAGSLFSIASLLIASVIGKYATGMNMKGSSLAAFLHGQKTNIMSMLPAGLSGIASLLGLSKLEDINQNKVNNTSSYIDETIDDSKRRISWLLWLLLLVLFVLAIWYFSGKGCNNVKPGVKIKSK